MDLIYSDILGYNGSRYLVTFTCDYSKLIAVYLIKAKGDITDSFIYFKKYYKRPDLSWVIKRLRNNNRGEYIVSKFQKVLFKRGIRWEPTELYTSQINRSTKRLGQTIYWKAAPLLKYTSLSLKFWPEVVKYTIYLYIRSPHSKIRKTPFEV
jgi:hypothetical protein